MPDIDFVIPWVDGSDPEWLARKNAYIGRPSEDDREERYRDWDLLRYWFRGVEKFTPWVRKIWFICDQEPPKWMNTDHPKLEIVRHEDYLPEEYRPAYSSHPIELNMHRINGLSERFVYFNDDMYVLRPLREDYFFKNGLPRDSALLNPIQSDTLAKLGKNGRIFTIFLNNTEYMNRDYSFRACLKKHPFNWLHPSYGKDLLRNAMLCLWPRFVGFIEPHLPQAFLKSSFEKAWKQDFDILDATSRRHIRDDRDVNQWLIREQQLAEGRFAVRKPVRDSMFNIGDDRMEMYDAIARQTKPMICLNDNCEFSGAQADALRRKLEQSFDGILGDASRFEIEA